VTANTTPDFSTTFNNSSACARSNVSGLSQMTLYPASANVLAISKCVWFGVATLTKSIGSGRFFSASAISLYDP
jgi:hypothetical protein